MKERTRTILILVIAALFTAVAVFVEHGMHKNAPVNHWLVRSPRMTEGGWFPTPKRRTPEGSATEAER